MNNQENKPKSSKLLCESRTEENDLKSLSLFNRSVREKRIEVFENEWVERLNNIVDLEKRNNGSYSFYTDEYEMIDYYPKANKILIRKDNKWIKPGLKWIIENIL